jgi:hypothetical protein
MEPTSEPDNRQSRGLARFWPGHGMPTPAQRQSAEDPDAERAATAAHASDQPAGAAGPTGEHPQVSDQQSQPHDDQQEPDEQSPNPFAPRPHPALTSDTQMVALGSRRPADALLGGSGNARWTNQGGFPPVETNGHRNGEAGPRHGGAPIANGQPPAGNATLPGSRSPFSPGGDDAIGSSGSYGSPGSPGSFGDEQARSAFIPPDEPSVRPAFPAADAPGPRSPFAPGDSDPPGPRSPFPATGHDHDSPGPRSPFPSAGHDQPGPRSPFAPADDNAPAGPLYAPSPFAPPASGSASVTSAHPTVPNGSPAAAPQQAARPVSANPSAAGSAQVPIPMGGRPVSAPPVPAETAAAPGAQPAAPARQEQARQEAAHQEQVHQEQARNEPARSEAARSEVTRLEPTRLEPTGWATAGPLRPGASGSATVPVSAPGSGRRSRDDEAADAPVAPAPRRSSSLEDVPEPAGRGGTGEAPLRPGDVNDISITFWSESASEQFRAEWHEVKAQFVDDPEAALTRAHDLLTEAVHELTESMLAERDELDPLRGVAKPDTESMRMAMRGYREFLDRILAL